MDLRITTTVDFSYYIKRMEEYFYSFQCYGAELVPGKVTLAYGHFFLFSELRINFS